MKKWSGVFGKAMQELEDKLICHSDSSDKSEESVVFTDEVRISKFILFDLSNMFKYN